MANAGHRFLSFAALVAALYGVPAQAQNGRIRGVVRDAHGVALSGATIRVANQRTGAARRTTSDPDGGFAVASLAPGAYTVSSSLPGLRTQSQQDVQVTADAEAVVDFVMQPLELEAITVTAMLREQELATVPFSIAAPTEQVLRMRGAENIEAIAANVAGFSVQNLGPGQSQVAMRGASSGQIARDQPGVKEEVGAYLDETPISLSLFTPDLDLFDVARVEVLRGPQGTLFGAGSLAGTVRYISNQPQLGLSQTFGEAGINQVDGGSSGSNAKLGFNVPMGEKAAFRIVGYSTETPGWQDAVQPTLKVFKNVNTGNRTGARAAFQLAPSGRFSITPRVIYQRVGSDGWNRIDAFNILANPYTTTRYGVRLGNRQLFTQMEEPFTDLFALADVNLRVNMPGGMSLTSITSYTDRDIHVVRDAGALTASITGGNVGVPEAVYTLDSPLDDHTHARVATQEVRLAGAGGSVRWVVGGFYSKNHREYSQQLTVTNFTRLTGIPTRGFVAPQDGLFWSALDYNLKHYAAFGEATISLTQLDLTAGLRYYNFNENRDQFFDGIFGNDNNGTALVRQPGSTKADGVAPRFIASYKVSDALTVNAQASRGFRLGGINDPLNVPLCTAADLATFSGRDSWIDEKAWNYEAGIKSRMANGRASINLSAFYMDIKNLQLTVTAGSCSSRLIFNVPKATSQGLEAEITASPNEHLDLNLSASFTNSKLKSTVRDGSGAVIAGIQEGNRLPSVPKTQVSAAATYGWPVGASRTFVSGSYQYVGSRYTLIDDETPGYGTVSLTTFGANTIGGPLTQTTFSFNPLLPGYSIANARVGMTRSSWEVALFVNNLLDKTAFLALDRERGKRARVGYLTNQPRTAGVSLRFNY
jgi:iron complex outermembrane receptor protein